MFLNIWKTSSFCLEFMTELITEFHSNIIEFQQSPWYWMISLEFFNIYFQKSICKMQPSQKWKYRFLYVFASVWLKIEHQLRQQWQHCNYCSLCSNGDIYSSNNVLKAFWKWFCEDDRLWDYCVKKWDHFIFSTLHHKMHQWRSWLRSYSMYISQGWVMPASNLMVRNTATQSISQVHAGNIILVDIKTLNWPCSG